MQCFFFHFLNAYLLLNWDKYFALYWCFCVRIFFILLLGKWSEKDPNVQPQTLVETFDQANYNSIPEYSSHNFFDLSCVNVHS